jgi:hypothetical protein
MANESALRDGNGAPTILYEENGETRRVSDVNPLPVVLAANSVGLLTATLEKVGNGTVALVTPAAGKKVAVRGVMISPEPASGYEADIRFAVSGKVIHKIYRSDQSGCLAPVYIDGNVNEAVNAVVAGAGAGQRIFFVVNYQEK